ncbi:lipopolysaccharide biosynthesis protein [Planctopirus hydrillae]|uniref:Polysaccharide biosynthesis protein C-terminal domain-containing protein n=1 Tax=Planctopirus hydrillae TaxID=1841610 RepID=A0A1C3E8K5_9PLAN|nr:oligosaccharide flippase family protein [Planctopirus hydrillae]ODA29570.1 hypothetical protein A6X21_07780 [Planctopirus hydrillae]
MPLNSVRQLLQVKSESLIAFLNHCLGYTLQLAMFGLFAIKLSPNEYGEFVICLAWSLIMARLAALGIDFTMTRFIAKYDSTKCNDTSAALISWGYRRILTASITLSILTLIFGGLWNLQFNEEYTLAIVFTALLTPISTCINVLFAELRGRAEILLSTFGLNCARPLITILSLFVINGTNNSTILEASASYLFGSLSSLALLAIGCAGTREEKSHNFAHLVAVNKNEWWNASWPLLITGLAQLALRQSDVIILGMVASTEEVAYYSLATKIAGICIFGVPIIDSIVAAKFTRLHEAGIHHAQQSLITKAARINLLITIMAAIAAVSISLLISSSEPRFNARIALLTSIISFGWVLVALIGTGNILFAMSGKEAVLLRITIIFGLATIISNFIFGGLLGSSGMAVSVSAITALYAVYSRRMIFKHLDLNVNPLSFAHMRRTAGTIKHDRDRPSLTGKAA